MTCMPQKGECEGSRPEMVILSGGKKQEGTWSEQRKRPARCSIEPAYGYGSVVKSSARVSSLGFDLFPTPLPTPEAETSQARAQQDERGSLRNGCDDIAVGNEGTIKTTRPSIVARIVARIISVATRMAYGVGRLREIKINKTCMP